MTAPSTARTDRSVLPVRAPVDLDGLARECLSLAPAGLTLRELIERCNERLPEPWAGEAAQELVFSLHGHLHRFVVQGKVSVARDGDRPIFRWRG